MYRCLIASVVLSYMPGFTFSEVKIVLRGIYSKSREMIYLTVEELSRYFVDIIIRVSAHNNVNKGHLRFCVQFSHKTEHFRLCHTKLQVFVSNAFCTVVINYRKIL